MIVNCEYLTSFLMYRSYPQIKVHRPQNLYSLSALPPWIRHLQSPYHNLGLQNREEKAALWCIVEEADGNLQRLIATDFNLQYKRTISLYENIFFTLFDTNQSNGYLINLGKTTEDIVQRFNYKGLIYSLLSTWRLVILQVLHQRFMVHFWITPFF